MFASYSSSSSSSSCGSSRSRSSRGSSSVVVVVVLYFGRASFLSKLTVRLGRLPAALTLHLTVSLLAGHKRKRTMCQNHPPARSYSSRFSHPAQHIRMIPLDNHRCSEETEKSAPRCWLLWQVSQQSVAVNLRHRTHIYKTFKIVHVHARAPGGGRGVGTHGLVFESHVPWR